MFNTIPDPTLLNHPLIDPERLLASLDGGSQKLRFASVPPSYLRDHAFRDMPVFPGTAYIDLAFFVLTLNPEFELPVTLQNIRFDSALLLDSINQDPPEILHTIDGNRSGALKFVSSTDNTSVYAQIEVLPYQPAFGSNSSAKSLDDARLTCTTAIDTNQFYTDLHVRKNQYGDAFRVIQSLSVSEAESCAFISVDNASNTLDGYAYHPSLLDGCIQALSATHDSAGRTFVFTKVGRVDFHQRVGTSCWAHATRTSPAGGASEVDGITGNISVFTTDGELAIQFWDVEFKYLAQEEATTNKPAQTIAISATFTSEPLEDVLNFWSKELAQNLDVQFAPYNQVFQQLLNPTSIQLQNQSGLNVILLRFEDWLNTQDAENRDVESRADQADALLAEHDRYKLPNGMEIASLNPYETEYVYKEIFVDNAYLKHDVVINDGDTIIDIGANIGLFTMWIQTQAQDTTVHSFEPSPPVFDILQTNALLHGQNVHVHNFGVSDRKKSAEFTFYAKSSVFSSFSADEEEDGGAIRAVVENMVRDNIAGGIEDIDAIVDELMDDRLESEAFTCQLISLSDVIAEQNIKQIDLLKLDAEKSELEVLQGIQDYDWPKIKQIVMEVHDKEGPLIEAVTDLLRTKGFELAIEEETYLQNSGLFNIFASRPDVANRASETDKVGVEKAEPTADEAQVRDTLANFVAALQSATEQAHVPFLICICPPSPETVAAYPVLLNELDAELTNSVASMPNVYLRTYDETLKLYDIADYHDPAKNALGHIPYKPDYFAGLGTQIVRANALFSRLPYKVIVLDCDNTLWQGVVGEDGPEGIVLTAGHQYLQEFMLKQMDAGMILCLCSKNIESDVVEALADRNDMPLNVEHIVGMRVNWQPKSTNLRELSQELQLGLDSFIFLDDNPIECAEVRAACPEVLTLQVPANGEELPHFLNNIWAFDTQAATAEDAQRTQMYRQNMEREQYRTKSISLDSFLEGLALDIQIQPLSAQYLERVSQLTQRTNQFNFTTIRRSVSEIQQATQSNELKCLIVHVSDRFGSYGLVGVAMYSINDSSLSVDTMLLSCRVLGRGVEHRMLARLGEIALENDCTIVDVPFTPTKKNQPAGDFLDSVALAYSSNATDDIQYQIPADIAAQISYQPQQDIAYAEKAMERSVNQSAKKQEVSLLPARYDEAMKIATELSSIENILAGMTSGPRKHRPSIATEYVPPVGSEQEKIASIWGDVLSIDKIGIHDNFFELGGSSLKGVQLIAQLKSALNVDFTIVSLFEHPTVAAMTNVVVDNPANGTAAKADESKARGENRRAKLRARRRK